MIKFIWMTGVIAAAGLTLPARAHFERQRRIELNGFTANADPELVSAALVWPTVFAPQLDPARRSALVDDVLRVEQILGPRLGLTRVEVRDAFDLILNPAVLITRAANGRLNQPGVNRYDENFRRVALKHLSQNQPEFARRLDTAPDRVALRTDLFGALNLADRRGRQAPLAIGFRDLDELLADFGGDIWRRDEQLTQLARAHLDARAHVTRLRGEVEALAESALRDLTIELTHDLESALTDQVFALPARVGRTIELNRRRRGRQQYPARQSWTSLEAPTAIITPAAWRHVIDQLECERQLGG